MGRRLGKQGKRKPRGNRKKRQNIVKRIDHLNTVLPGYLRTVQELMGYHNLLCSTEAQDEFKSSLEVITAYSIEFSLFSYKVQPK